MEYEEYMVSLTEQIHDKRAKQLVAQEIRNHIEEQAEMYEMDGIEHTEAIQEAVRQMGNPVETGMELNKIHKPKMPWAMIGIVIGLMIASIIMQAVIFAEGVATHRNWGNLITQTLVYNGIGFAVVLLLLYVDYNFIGKYAYRFYAVFMIGLPMGLIGAELVSTGSAAAITAYYGIQMLFPIIFAGIVYRNRNRGRRGMTICLVLGVLEILWYSISGSIFGKAYNYRLNASNAETFVILILIITVAVWKGIFGKDRKKQVVFLGAVWGVLVVSGVVFLFYASGLGGYVWHRFLNIFTRTESSYMNVLLQEAVAKADWLGGQTFFMGAPNAETYTTFALNSVITYFGRLAGIIVIATFILFLVMALHMSLKQSNRIGLLIGTACTIGILVRFTAYVAINMGRGLWWTTLVPFFSYGKVSAVMNGIYIGLILCVYRNSSILREDYIPQKRLPRIHVTIE